MEANGRLQRSNNRGLWRLEQQMLVARVLGGSCGEGFLSILKVLGVLRLANSRLERPNNRGLWRQTAGCNALTTKGYGGKREAATLEQ